MNWVLIGTLTIGMVNNGYLGLPVTSYNKALLNTSTFDDASFTTGRVLHISSSSGNDANTGASPGSAWRTLNKLASSILHPGDTVLLKRGDTWREQLTVPSSGSAGSPIIFGAYGSGPKPIIKGSDLVTGFTSEAVSSFTAYKKVLSTRPTQLFENGNRIMQVGAKASLVAGSWFWDSGKAQIYVRTSGDNNPSGYTIEASVRARSVYIAQSNITIQDLDISQGKNYGIQGSKSNITIQRCTIHDAFLNNVEIGSLTALVTPTVLENDIYGAGATGIMLSFNFTGLRIQGNTVHENSRLHDTLVGGDVEQQYSAGIKIWTNEMVNAGANTLVSENTVWGNGPSSWVTPNGHEDWRGFGIWLDQVRIPDYLTLGAELVKYNRVYNNLGGGIYFEKTQGCGAEYNLVYNNATYSFTANLWLGSNSGRDAPGPSWAYNNTIYGTGWAAVMMGNDNTGAASTFTNHSVKNNIIWCLTSPNRHLRIDGTGGDVASGNAIDFNLYGTGTFDVAAFFSTFGVNYSSLASWQSASGQDAHSLNADPLFTNVGTLDFTLQATSPAINAAVNLGSAHQTGLLPNSDWPASVVTGNQNSYGAGWEIGAFQLPVVITVIPLVLHNVWLIFS